MSHALWTAVYATIGLWPLACLLLVGKRRSITTQNLFARSASFPALLLAGYSVFGLTPGEVALPGVLLGITWTLDPIRSEFLLVTSLVWLLASMHIRWHIDPARQCTFIRFYLLAMSGNFFLCIADDVISFYTGYALMSFATFGLVVFNGNEHSQRAGLWYIVFMLASELLLFAALTLAHPASGNEQYAALKTTMVNRGSFWPSLLFIAALGIKSGLLGLHFWMPSTYQHTPSSAAAPLAGVMVKAGILGWIMMLPMGLVGLNNLAGWISVLGICGCFYGALVGLLQTNPKRLLAYSSISQMGLFIIGVGLALRLPEHRDPIIALLTCLAVHHSLNKAALFLGTDWLTQENRCRNWIMWCGFLLPSLALAGFPLLSGMLAKNLLKQQLHSVHADVWIWISALLPWASFATGLLMARFQFLLLPTSRTRSAIDWVKWCPWITLILLAQLTPWTLYGQTATLSGKVLWSGLWPVLLAFGLACFAARSRFARGLTTWMGQQRSMVMQVPQRMNLLTLNDSHSICRKTEKGYSLLRLWLSRLSHLTHDGLMIVETKVQSWSIALSTAVCLLLLLIFLLLF